MSDVFYDRRGRENMPMTLSPSAKKAILPSWLKTAKS